MNTGFKNIGTPSALVSQEMFEAPSVAVLLISDPTIKVRSQDTIRSKTNGVQRPRGAKQVKQVMLSEWEEHAQICPVSQNNTSQSRQTVRSWFNLFI